MPQSIVRARHLIARPDLVIDDGALLQRDGAIEAVGSWEEVRRAAPDAPVLGGSDYVAMPGLVNAHHHGRGVGGFLGGHADDALERWLLRIPAQRPGLDARLGALVSALAMVRSGTTTVLHNHLGPGAPDAVGAYAAVGMRAALSSAYIERAFYAYDDDAFLASLPADLAAQARAALPPPPGPSSRDAYFDLVDELVEAAHAAMGGRARVMISPVGLYWAADDFLTRCREEAARRGVGVHMHLLETPYQRAAARRMYGVSAVEHLARLGLLGVDVSFAHCVWADERDVALLAEHGSPVCHCPGSNLRLRNGKAPVPALLRAGVPVALGTDGFSLKDDDDLLQEMALAANLNAQPSLDAPALSAADALAMATTGGAALTGFDGVGTLEIGKRADVALLDWHRVSAGVVDPGAAPMELLVHRARGSDVDTVMVDGEVVYQGGRFTRVDEQAVLAEAAEALNAAPPADAAAGALADALTPHLERYCADLISGA